MMRSSIWLLSLVSFIMLCSFASSTTITVGIKEAKVNESFKLSITCDPTEPIKSFEFNVLFDPRILSATSVTAGEFFEGKATFSSPNCVINNTLGTIINIYDLTLGQGNMVTEPGVLVYIRFTAKQNGTTNITLSDAGVTNGTQYLPLSVTNGTVTVNGYIPPGEQYIFDEPQENNNEFLPGFSDLIIILIIGVIIFFIFTKLSM
jgi:hypothetical protein